MRSDSRRQLDALFGAAPEREPSRALPSGAYRDPADYLEQIESRTCKGCRFEKQVRLEALRKEYTICIDRLKNGKRRDHGKRCERYRLP